jgi:hypothetical protein
MEEGNIAVEGMIFPLKHPKAVFASITLDKKFSNLFLKASLLKRIKTSLYKLIYPNM